MRSLFLVGFPRAGAGALARGLRPAGYDLGPDPARGPEGSAADAAVPRALAALNEGLLLRMEPRLGPWRGRRWLAELGPGTAPEPRDEEGAAMAELLARRPFCLWDPRFAWTLSAWRGLAPGAAFVCLFRDPREAVAAVLEAARRDPLLAEAPPTPEALLRAWVSAHRRVLEEHALRGDWLFLHQRQLLAAPELRGRGAPEDAARRISALAGAPFDPRGLYPELAREAPDGAPRGEAGELYAELCARAGHRVDAAPARTSAGMPPEVAAAVPVREGEAELARATVESLLAQRGARAEVLVVDQTLAGGLAFEGARVLREPSPSRGRAYLAALEATAAPWIAWQEPGTRALPHRLARLLRAARGQAQVELWTSDLWLSGDGDAPPRLESGPAAAHAVTAAAQAVTAAAQAVTAAAHAIPAAADAITGATDSIAAATAAPAGGLASTVMVRRGRLAGIDPRAFTPAELELVARAAAEGRAGHLAEALVEMQPAQHAASAERARQDAELLALARAPHAGSPELTVLLACHDREDAILACLEGFARQLVPPGTLELVVVDDGSSDASPALVAALDLAVPLTHVRQENAGAASARNRGLPHVRGRYVLLVNDDTIPFPDTALRHLLAHRELADPRAIVLGTFEQPPEALRGALVRLLERTTHVFGYTAHEPGGTLGGEHLYTCNASMRSDALREIGGFEESLPCYGEDTELGLRLEREGYRVHYRPEARALHEHVPRFDAMRWRQRAVARAHVRIFERHPQRLFPGLLLLTRPGVAELVRQVAPHLPRIEAAARSLSGVDLAALEALGGAQAQTAQRIEEGLEGLFARLSNYWWQLGCADGLAEAGAASFAELVARRPLALAGPEGKIATAGPFALVRVDGEGAWLAAAERWLELEIERGERAPALVAAALPGAERAARVGRALAALAARLARRGAEPALHRASIDAGIEWARLLAAAGVWLRTGAEDEGERLLAEQAGVRGLELPARAGADPLEGARPLVVVAPLGAVCKVPGAAGPAEDASSGGSGAAREAPFGELFECCSPLAGRAGTTLALLCEPGAAARAALVRSVLAAALEGADGGPEVRVVPADPGALAALAARADLLLELDAGSAGVESADGPGGASAPLAVLPTATGRGGLERALRALDVAGEEIPFLVAEEPVHA